MNESTSRQFEKAFDLIAIDVDGTLLNSQHQLAEGVEDAIHQVRERGIEVTLVSGRGKLPLVPWLHQFNITAPYIAAGGSLIADPRDDRLIYQDRIDRELVVLAVTLARRAGVCIFFEEPDRMLGEGDPAGIAQVESIAGADVTVVQDILQVIPGSPPKIFLAGDHEALAQFVITVRQSHLPLHVAFSLPYFLEVTRQGVDKGSALRQLAAYLDIPLQRIAVIGDGDNDVSMFRVAGLAIAMGNAAKPVQAEAHLVAPTNDQGGAAWALREVMLRG